MRDLLKKATKRTKQNGTEPKGVKRLFQALRLTESALRNAPFSDHGKERRRGWIGVERVQAHQIEKSLDSGEAEAEEGSGERVEPTAL